jgi:hypothetical protein
MRIVIGPHKGVLPPPFHQASTGRIAEESGIHPAVLRDCVHQVLVAEGNQRVALAAITALGLSGIAIHEKAMEHRMMQAADFMFEKE